MNEIMSQIKGLQEEASFILKRMLNADQAEWIELNDELFAVRRKIAALSCWVNQNEILHI